MGTMTTDLHAAALQILEALAAPAKATDLRVLAVFLHVAAYPGPMRDVAAATGLSESAVAGYLAALGPALDARGGSYRLSARGAALFASSLGAPAPTASTTRSAPSALTPDEVVIWEEIKLAVMDAPPDGEGRRAPGFRGAYDCITLREDMAWWLAAYDSADPTKTEKMFIWPELPNYGIKMHRPGTSTFLEVTQFLAWRPELAPHEALLRKVARLGLGLW